MTIALETKGLEKSFGGLRVTRDLSLRVEQGARHALIGPNGAGKTTFINLLTGNLRPTSGRVLLDGEDITTLGPYERVRRGMARTFQINQLFGDMTPLETIGVAVSQRLGSGADWWRLPGSKSKVTDELVGMLERFRLADVMHERTATLDTGGPARHGIRDHSPVVTRSWMIDQRPSAIAVTSVLLARFFGMPNRYGLGVAGADDAGASGRGC